ncbi:hypothetical protein [Marinifilum flexuosum]|uniref:Uncharacterized protein n=1 Tax=Marinifilum flexuosum TaxID=1117708 RepID=A0A419XA63_9BACT|nr:hypothetical protein [Marinifilum flexuosum]RKE04449.1 hypothetical protein BXY64_1469 [Marinifilum flexuosum]
MTTNEIKGFFSPEHAVLVFLIMLSLYSNWRLHVSQTEIQADIKLITYRLDNGATTDKRKLVQTDSIGQQRSPKLQKANFPFIGYIHYHWGNTQSSD